MEDRDIIALFFARSERAIPELDRKHGPAVKRVTTHVLPDRRDAEECVNDTWLAAWNTIPPQTPDPLVTYVCRIARNLAVKRYHANTARKRGGGYETAIGELAASVPALETVESEMAARALTGALNDFLAGCGEVDRYLFVRRYWFADPVGEIAAALRWSGHRVSVRLYRLRERLRIHLEREGVLE